MSRSTVTGIEFDLFPEKPYDFHSCGSYKENWIKLNMNGIVIACREARMENVQRVNQIFYLITRAPLVS